jgi:uncharacterized membrane protein
MVINVIKVLFALLVNMLKLLFALWVFYAAFYVGVYMRLSNPEYTETQLFLYSITLGNIDLNKKGINE